jgi:hypothetical protein
MSGRAVSWSVEMAPPVIAKVPASIIETINKNPLELRDRKVLDIDPAQVSAITISSDQAATTRPTSRPAVKKDVALKRRKEPIGSSRSPGTFTAPTAWRSSGERST